MNVQKSHDMDSLCKEGIERLRVHVRKCIAEVKHIMRRSRKEVGAVLMKNWVCSKQTLKSQTTLQQTHK